MHRREFITLLGGAAAAWPLAAGAQQPAMPVVGFLSTGAPDTYAREQNAFHRGLNEGGFVDGRNVSFDYRWTGTDLGLIPALAADLVRRRVSVIAGLNTTTAALAVKTATTTIPSVFCLGGDPVKNGLVASMNRPGGNLTGVTFLSNELAPKRLGLLRDLVPNAAVIGFLINRTNPNAEADIAAMQSAARSVGQQIRIFNVSSERELAPLFSTFAGERINALVVGADPYLVLWSSQLIALAASHALPATYPIRETVEAGGLMSYSDDRLESWRQAGLYVGRILKGEQPANLPVLQPTKFKFVLNLKTARALSLNIPPGVLAIADEVIE
jgi:putative ABC transport system substrate-binding protein